MNTLEVYECEYCRKEFHHKTNCVEHESVCRRMTKIREYLNEMFHEVISYNWHIEKDPFNGFIDVVEN